MRRFCKSCLNYEGMRFWLHPRTLPSFAKPIVIGEDGRCSACSAFARWRSPVLRRREAESVSQAERREAVVLFSGGKDSSAMLLFALRTLRFRLTAVLFDNGCVPAETLRRAAALCAGLEVSLRVVRAEDLPPSEGRPSFQRALEQVTLDEPTPCLACGRHALEAAFAIGRSQQTPWVFQGTNYFAEWATVPRGIRSVEHEGFQHHLVNVPYVFGLTREDTLRLLQELDFESALGEGVSSNCTVPARVQAAVAAPLGHVPELEDLSLEVLVAHLGRAEALAELRRKAPAHDALLEGAD